MFKPHYWVHTSLRGHRLRATALILGCTCGLSDLQGQAVQETDGQGSEISPHAVVSCDWPCSCVAGRWQSVLSEQSVRGLLFGFGCAGAWQEQLSRRTGFPLFMWGPGISTPAHCCAGGAAPTAAYCPVKSVEGHGEGEGRRGMGDILPTILKDGHDTVWNNNAVHNNNFTFKAYT